MMINGKSNIKSRQIFLLISLLALIINALLYTSNVIAQSVVDLEISAFKTPNGVTLPGSGGILTFTITNHGPDTAGDFGGLLGGIIVVSGNMPIFPPYTAALPLILYTLPGQSCPLNISHADAIPPDPIQYTWVAYPGPIEPNETVVCSYNYIINDITQLEGHYFDMNWTVFSPPNRDTDTNPDNNTDHTRFFFDYPPPNTIPTLSVTNYFILSILLLLLTIFIRLSRDTKI